MPVSDVDDLVGLLVVVPSTISIIVGDEFESIEGNNIDDVLSAKDGAIVGFDGACEGLNVGLFVGDSE